MDSLFVTIWMVTYNHDKFIETAIESVMAQQTNFNYKLLIGEDCSTDNTRKICKKLKNKYPKKIKLILHEKNIGSTANGIFMYQECIKSKAKYIALCEGDDFWTDPLKLQKQVTFLEAHHEYVIASHNSNIVNHNDEFLRLFNKDIIPNTTNTEYILNHSWYLPTASLVFRTNQLAIPKWYNEGINGDYILQLILTANGGLVHYNNVVMSTYRSHDDGISAMFNGKNVFNYSMLFIEKNFNNYTSGRYYYIIRKNVITYSFNILTTVPIKSKEFWKVISNLILFNRGVNKRLSKYLWNRIIYKK